jgi:hypothetical protein
MDDYWTSRLFDNFKLVPCLVIPSVGDNSYNDCDKIGMSLSFIFMCCHEMITSVVLSFQCSSSAFFFKVMQNIYLHDRKVFIV